MAKSSTQEIKQAARRFGADIVGITNIERLEGAPEQFRATDILPSARSVVVMGTMLPGGITDCWEQSIWSYLYYGYIIPNKRLGAAAYDLARYLELAGHKSFPVVPTVYMKDCDVVDPTGEFSHRHAAFAAGLGEFGFSNLFLTPQFGSHNRFVSVLTSAELKPDPLYKGKPICDRCMKCIDACPTNALKKDRPRTMTVAGKTIEYAGLDKLACSYSLLGLSKESGGFVDIGSPKKDRYTKWDVALGKIRHFLKDPVTSFTQAEYQSVIDWADFCGLCLHSCDRPLKKKPYKPLELLKRDIRSGAV